MDDRIVDIIGIAGSALSLIGVVVALVQIRRTLRAAQAAEAAAREVQQKISRNVLLADVSTCVRSLEEIKVLVRGERHEAALMRVTDLSSLLIQLQQLRVQHAQQRELNFPEMLTQLSILREVLELKIYKQETEVDPVQVNSQLANISDQLSHVLGEEKYLTERNTDA